MNQHEIMDNMTHEEFETINNKNSSDEEKAKTWNDAAKRMENYYYGADVIGTKYVSSINEDFQELIKKLYVINETHNKTEPTNTANDIIQQLKEQNNILKSIDNHLDKLVRRPIK